MIEKIALHRFRGSIDRTEIDVPSGARLLLVHGPKGSGKSTISDAVEYALNGSAGSLEDRSGATARDLPSLGASSSEMSVEIHSGGAVWSSGNRAIARPRAYVLRRKQILALCEATPSERFEQIRRFLDISGVQKSEDALKKAIQASDAARKAADECCERAAAELHRLRGDAGNISEGSTHASSDGALLQELDTLICHIDSAAALVKGGKENRARVETLKSECQSLEARAEGQAGENLPSKTGLVSLLTEAESFFARAESARECPVCGRSATLIELRLEVRKTLEPLRTLQELTHALSAKRDEERAVREQLQSYHDHYAQAAATIRGFIGTAELGNLPGDAQGLDDSYLAKQILPLRESLAEKRSRIQERIGAQGAVQVHLRAIEEAHAVIEREKTCFERLDRAHRVVSETRHVFVQQILDSVSDECDGLFRILLPDAPITLGAMILEPARKASLKQSAYFDGGMECSPQAVFSDSHLDTMALCFWLALVLREAGEDSVIILDDALTSVDSDHAGRFAKLLYQLRSQFGMVIVSTHDASWRDSLENLGNDVHVVGLGAWSPSGGISVES